MNFQDMEYGDLIKHVEESIRALRLRAYKEGYEQGRFDERIKGSGSEQYQQQRRDEIVERAKRDIDELRDETFNYACYADFIVNRGKRTVLALIRDRQSGKVYARGIAKCRPDDCFNIHIGKVIALRRALNLEVPSEYLNSPQPVEVRVGDIVEGINGVYGIYTVRENTLSLNSLSVDYVRENIDTTLKIIDDSREGVAERES